MIAPMINRRAAFGTFTEALARRGDDRAPVSRLGIAVHGASVVSRDAQVDPLQVAATAHEPLAAERIYILVGHIEDLLDVIYREEYVHDGSFSEAVAQRGADA